MFRLRLHDRHVLVVGASGAGKASVFWSILAALAPLVRTGTVVLHGIDPKRMELVFAPELFTHAHDRHPRRCRRPPRATRGRDDAAGRTG